MVGASEGSVDGLPVGVPVGAIVVGAAEGAEVQIVHSASPHTLPSTQPHSFAVQSASAQ
jgi:hypothetical protein